MIPSAYVHVPFCAHICAYCAFDKSASLGHITRWLDVICPEIEKELSAAAADDASFALKTVYFGGGTPSVLPASALKRLGSLFVPYLDKEYEWTVEVNPEQVNAKWLRQAKSLGINRVSIGLQSFDDRRLESIGRKHTASQSRQAVALIKEAGFDNISADLMFGFAGQTLEDVEKDVDAFLALDIAHLSIYSLILEENSVFGKTGVQGVDEDLSAAMYERIVQRMKQAGYSHYEISSFAKEGFEGKHNLLIWQDGSYFGFGWGACGRDDRGLYHTDGSLQTYLEQGYQKRYDDNETAWFDAIMTGLRTRKGVDIVRWQNRWHKNFHETFAPALRIWADWLEENDGFLSCTEAGMEVLDSILVEFLQCG